MNETMSVRASLAWTRDVVRNWGRWTRGHLLMTLGLSALAFAVGWVWNTYLMAVDLEGSVVAPGTETTATADEHTGNGLFWLLLFSLAGGVITYAWSRGWKNFWTDLAVLPRRFAQGMTRSPAGAFTMLLWGTAVSLLISTLISSAVSLALGLVLVALAATPIGVILNFALIRLWRGLSGIVAPNAGAGLALMVSPLMVMFGEALGLFLDWVIGQWLVGLGLGIACALLSLVLARGAPPRAVTGLLVVGVAVAWQVLRVRWAYADDGGWGECVTPDGQACSEAGLLGVFDWLRSPGAGHLVVRGTIGGGFAALGAFLGLGLGGAAAGVAVAAAQTGAPGRPSGPGTGGSGAGDLGAGDAGEQTWLTAADHQPMTGESAVPPASAADPQLPAQRSGQSDLWTAGDTGGHAAAGGDAGSTGQLGAGQLGGDQTGGGQMGGGQAGAGQAGAGQADSGQAGSAGTSGYGYQFDVSDILPEEPDRDEEEDGGEAAGPPSAPR